jgi:hypothetical protein
MVPFASHRAPAHAASPARLIEVTAFLAHFPRESLFRSTFHALFLLSSTLTVTMAQQAQNERTPLLSPSAVPSLPPAIPHQFATSTRSSATLASQGAYRRLLITALLLSISYAANQTTLFVQLARTDCRMFYEDGGEWSGSQEDRYASFPYFYTSSALTLIPPAQVRRY